MANTDTVVSDISSVSIIRIDMVNDCKVVTHIYIQLHLNGSF